MMLQLLLLLLLASPLPGVWKAPDAKAGAEAP